MFGAEPFRLEPKGKPQDYRTFAARMPVDTHTRAATCEEYGCPMRARGWRTIVDERSEPGRTQGLYIRKHSGREFTVDVGGDNLTTFTFTAGQECFASGRHRVPNGRPEQLLIVTGDWRQYDRSSQRQAGRGEWADRLGESVIAIAERRQKG